jgi:hypothetical protein
MLDEPYPNWCFGWANLITWEDCTNWIGVCVFHGKADKLVEIINH